MFGFLSIGVLCICLLQGFGAYTAKRVASLRSQITADAAALAAISHGDEAAEHFASVNGGTIESLRRYGDLNDHVEVVVLVNGIRATATATDSW